MIDYELEKTLEGVTIVEGFPTFGLVSTISIEFLMDHLDAERIGEFVYDELSPTLAIHKGELVHPMSIWYSEKHDLVLLHTTLNVKDLEWDMAEIILDLAEELEAEEIISVEGVPMQEEEMKAYTYGNEDLEECGAEPLHESILLGITAALMLRGENVTPLFASAHSKLPDAEAASKVVEVLSDYLDLDMDTEPLRKKAEEFENKIQSILQQSKEAEEEAKRKRLNYLG